jgi:COMPASS component SDC1
MFLSIPEFDSLFFRLSVLPHVYTHTKIIQPESQPLAAMVPAPRAMAPPGTPSVVAPPKLPNPHGAQARIYLNKNVTPHLLEGVKHLAMERPEQPLKWLAEFLAKRSEEVEGSGNGIE